MAYPDLRFNDNPQTYPYPFLHDPDFKDLSSSTSAALNEIWRRFINQPTKMVKWYLVGKPILLWQWDIVHGRGGAFVYPVAASPYNTSNFYRLTYMLSQQIHSTLVMLGLLGSLIVWLPGSRKVLDEKAVFVSRVMSLILFYFTFVHAVTFAEARYATPLLPILTMMALIPVIYMSAWLNKDFRPLNR